MSGGYFDYDQYRISSIVDSIQSLIDSNEDESLDEYGYKKGRFYSSETIERFKEAVDVLKRGEILAHRIDWLVSEDDGEETFHKRLKELLE